MEILNGVRKFEVGTVAKATMVGAAGRRARNRREMREAILDAARQIVAERGAEALTMRAIGQTIGYSAAALYEYFPAKEDLYGCLYFEGGGGLSARMRDALAGLDPGATALDRMGALGHAYRAFAHEQPDLFRLALGNPTPSFSPGFNPRPSAGEAEEETVPEKDAFALLLDVAHAGVERGEFAPLPPIAVALAAWAAVHGFVILELNGHLSTDGRPSMKEFAAAGEVPSLDDLFAATLRLCATGFLRR